MRDVGAPDGATDRPDAAGAQIADPGVAESGDGAADGAGDAAGDSVADDGDQDGCVPSGGAIVTAMCCLSVGPLPNTCLVGACGCSPANSHPVSVCQCPEGACFDGTRCVPR